MSTLMFLPPLFPHNPFIQSQSPVWKRKRERERERECERERERVSERERKQTKITFNLKTV